MLTHGNSTSGSVGHTMTAEMNYVDMIFPAQGAAIPRNHGYAQYRRISRGKLSERGSVAPKTPEEASRPIDSTFSWGLG
jgi:hypothetical protein